MDTPVFAAEKFRPALRSAWFLFFGLALGPAVLLLERDPEGHPAKWAALSIACLLVIVHRFSLKYTLTATHIEAESWWGLGRRERVSLAALRGVRPCQGVAGRLVGCGHLEVESEAPDEAGLSILGQPEYLALARRLESLAERAKMETANRGS
ncbi:MAG: hypothetical protein LBV79_10030 [Candidatus Adiutrix sp.]|jgi:hypothetical protein|nr:hypothetical protein [Candidatus Adiutrix sp.]